MISPSPALDPATAVTDCRFHSVWSQVSSSLSNLRSVFSQNEQVADGLKKFTRSLAAPAAERIGWEFQANEDYLVIQLRKLLISMAGNAGHEK
jgi:hypothetical protein